MTVHAVVKCDYPGCRKQDAAKDEVLVVRIRRLIEQPGLATGDPAALEGYATTHDAEYHFCSDEHAAKFFEQGVPRPVDAPGV